MALVASLRKSITFVAIMHVSHDELRAIDLNLVLALDALLAERHVTRAAERLGITQSAASHALARLRDLLDDPLLVRGPRGTMLPTPRATELAPAVHRVLDDLAVVLRGQAVFDPATAKHTFRIGGGDYIELVLLPRLVARLAQRAPGIDVWVHSFGEWGDEELAAGKVDLVIAPPRRATRPAGSYEKVLFEETFTCVMREGHPLAGARMTLPRYASANHVMVAPRGTPGSIVDDALARAGRSRRIAVAVPHFLVVPFIVATTDLIATLPTRVAAMLAGQVGLVCTPPPIDIAPFQMAMAWHERMQTDVRHRWLREQVVAAAAEIGR
jgi:DNA-binding transcriptional LysR family regulator